jgi:hypothetical protein
LPNNACIASESARVALVDPTMSVMRNARSAGMAKDAIPARSDRQANVQCRAAG